MKENYNKCVICGREGYDQNLEKDTKFLCFVHRVEFNCSSLEIDEFIESYARYEGAR